MTDKIKAALDAYESLAISEFEGTDLLAEHLIGLSAARAELVQRDGETKRMRKYLDAIAANATDADVMGRILIAYANDALKASLKTLNGAV